MTITTQLDALPPPPAPELVKTRPLCFAANVATAHRLVDKADWTRGRFLGLGGKVGKVATRELSGATKIARHSAINTLFRRQVHWERLEVL